MTKSLFGCVHDRAHAADPVEPGLAARIGQEDAGLRTFAHEPLFLTDIAGLFEFFQVGRAVNEMNPLLLLLLLLPAAAVSLAVV